MLTGVHFLLSYTCNLSCDHCFLFCGPSARGTMRLQQIRTVLEESKKIGTIDEVYLEGGEPFLLYPLLLESVRQAREMGFATGIVTNGYWATTIEDAKLWLEPLAKLGISDLSVSDDDLHYGDRRDSPAKYALAAAQALGIPAYALSKAKPEIRPSPGLAGNKGVPEISGGIKLRGRAVEKFAANLPTRTSAEFRECPYEDLIDPKRVHVDAYGTVQICQGISMGNCWKTPFSDLVRSYDAAKHPICGPLARGGPIGLVNEHDLHLKDAFVDECHLCYAARAALLGRFPEQLAPRQVYGLA